MAQRPASSGNLTERLAERAQGGVPAARSAADTVHAYLKRMGPEIARALPKHMDPDRLARIALTTIRTTPRLLECSMPSLMAAVMQAAQLGLEPGLLGHCYILPFRNNKTGQYEAQFMIGYRGMIDLARRSGEVQSISAREVYENDGLEVRYGLEERIVHIPWHLREDKEFDEPGEFRGVYMVARFKDGGYYCHYMPKAEIDAHRKRSKASSDGPWVTDYIEMAKKTVVRNAWKWLPISVEVMRRVEASDETVKREIAEDMSDVSDVLDAAFQADDGGGHAEPETAPAGETAGGEPDGHSTP